MSVSEFLVVSIKASITEMEFGYRFQVFEKPATMSSSLSIM